MKLTVTEHPDVLIVEPRVFEDSRGAFFEAYNQTTFKKLGLPNDFVQDNQSTSTKDVLRGLHYQIGQPQGKLIRVLRGEIFDVSIDCRRKSQRFRQSVCVRLSAENRKMLWFCRRPRYGELGVIPNQGPLLFRSVKVCRLVQDDRLLRFG